MGNSTDLETYHIAWCNRILEIRSNECKISDLRDSSIIYNQKNISIVGYGSYHLVLSDDVLNRLYRCPNNIFDIVINPRAYKLDIEKSVHYWNLVHHEPAMQAKIERTDGLGIDFRYLVKSHELDVGVEKKVDDMEIMTVPRIEGMTLSDYEDEMFKEYFKGKLSDDDIDTLSNLTTKDDIDQFKSKVNRLVEENLGEEESGDCELKTRLNKYLTEIHKYLIGDAENVDIRKRKLFLNRLKFNIGQYISLSDKKSLRETFNDVFVRYVRDRNPVLEPSSSYGLKIDDFGHIRKKAESNLMIPIMDEIVRIYINSNLVIIDGHFANFIYNYDKEKNIKATCIDLDMMVDATKIGEQDMCCDHTGMAQALGMLAQNFEPESLKNILIGDENIKQDLFDFIIDNKKKPDFEKTIVTYVEKQAIAQNLLNETDIKKIEEKELNFTKAKQIVDNKVSGYLDKNNDCKFWFRREEKVALLTPLFTPTTSQDLLNAITTAITKNNKITSMFASECEAMLNECLRVVDPKQKQCRAH